MQLVIKIKRMHKKEQKYEENGKAIKRSKNYRKIWQGEGEK